MMKNNQLSPAKKSAWQGYTLEELQYARMIALTRIEIEKSKLMDVAESTRSNLPIIGAASSMGSVFKSISKLEYIIIAFKLFRKIAPLFKKKK
ncbi:MAG: hypothetical protein K2K00_10190 [Muribaculaceae bacterium]|nr:hypothetical protein [Muribaculaceae bacterium]